MKGQIIITCIPDDEVNAVAEAESWPAEGTRTGIRVDTSLVANRSDCVEVVYTLCRALGFDDMQKFLLLAKLTGGFPNERRKEVELRGPLHGRPADPDAAPPPRRFNDTPDGGV